MAEHETIADIVADMRGIRVREFQDYADRIEAAHKREKAAIEANALEVGGIVEAAHRRELSKNVSKNKADFGQLGDAAKLREALEELVANIEMRSSTFGLNVMVDTKTYLDAKAALSAPPRNCERFQTVKQAKEAYSAEVRRIYIWDGCETERLVDWLLATATEKEGVKDGNE